LVLRDWVRRPFAFLGLIGSKRKRRLIFEQFVRDGIATEAQLANVACPVGLDIQAVSVPEIAVSVMAQLIQRRAALEPQEKIGCRQTDARIAIQPLEERQ
jgi:xanthine dehydrogenase accessory factor